MVDVRELLEYNREVRHRYFDALAKLPRNELVRNREASFHSIRNIFVHTLSAIDYWLDFLQKEQLHIRRRYDEYENIEEIRGYMEHVEARLEGYMDNPTTDGLMREYTRMNAAKETIKITAEDVLIHIFEEEVHHRGELIALLWQMGVEPPLMAGKAFRHLSCRFVLAMRTRLLLFSQFNYLTASSFQVAHQVHACFCPPLLFLKMVFEADLLHTFKVIEHKGIPVSLIGCVLAGEIIATEKTAL